MFQWRSLGIGSAAQTAAGRAAWIVDYTDVAVDGEDKTAADTAGDEVRSGADATARETAGTAFDALEGDALTSAGETAVRLKAERDAAIARPPAMVSMISVISSRH